MTQPFSERFWSRVEITPTCWQWIGHLTNGYGYIGIGGRASVRFHRAHRVAYEMLRGPIPAGLDIDHLCRNRRCVNPEHLEPVTRSTNLRRGYAARGLKTHCPQGHEFTPENTYRSPADTGRRCRTCIKVRNTGRLVVAS